jgi:hypothetical protein
MGAQSDSGRGGEEKNYQPLPGLEPPTINLVAQHYTAELYRLLTYLHTESNAELLKLSVHYLLFV